jgi:hypothetical protein
MHKTPERNWSVYELTAELRGSVPMVETILKSFLRSGLVIEAGDGRYHYAAADTLDALVAEMLRLYAERPVAVISAIAASPADKIQTFVDAFRLKKD